MKILLRIILLIFPSITISIARTNQNPEFLQLGIFEPKISERVSPFFPENFTISSLPSFSNDNFLLENEEKKIVIRIPGKYMNFLVDRHSEYKNSLLTRKAGLNPLEVLYFDLNDGLQITRYLEEAIFLSIDALNDREKICGFVDLLKKLHESGIVFENKFNPFYRLKKILAFLKMQQRNFSSFFHDILFTVDRLEKILEWKCFESKPCHNDPIPSNFVLIDNLLKLIDWEYAGSNDPAWDLAYFFSFLSLSSEEEKFFVTSYSLEKADIIQKKMIFFRPIIHLTISMWAKLQALEGLSEDFFEEIYIEHFEKYQKLILSEDFTLAIESLKEYECETPQP